MSTIERQDELDIFQELLDVQKRIATDHAYRRFIQESNAIENIHRPPTTQEIAEFARFMKLKSITVHQLSKFVSVFEPGATLRLIEGQNVRVGSHLAPPGGAHIKDELNALLRKLKDTHPFDAHLEYERLHPFTDCNGRSGRAIWAWQMRSFPLGFLHTFYYQSLEHSRRPY